jgi:hypothetical protein
VLKSEIKAVQVESKSDFKAVLGELKSEIKAVQVESKSDLKAVQVESKSDLKAVLGEIKAVQEASIHRAELNSGEMKVLLATVTRLASLVENADARNLRDL